jgi:Protein kinase domain
MRPLSARDPETIGEFRLRGILGEGGMGRVYLGLSQAGRRVAVKVVHSHLASDQEFLERFRQEVEAARAVSGMYTAPVVGAGPDDDPPWMATAFVPGPSLGWVVKRRGPLPDAAIWPLAAGVAEALGAVHAAGVVHRDLSPANVLLADDGPRVIDFGISRALDGVSLTQTGHAMGTPGYMSPERLQGEPVGPASDFFSLGCVLAYAATGEPPFGDGPSESFQYRVLMTEPELETVNPRLRQVIDECLRKDPVQRPDARRLIAMLADGPGYPGADRIGGSFWPAPVARLIAEAQAEEEMLPPTRGAAPPPATPPAGSSAVGHAPMIPDGYSLPTQLGQSGGQSGAQSAGGTLSLGRTALGSGALGTGPRGSGGNSLPGYLPGHRRPQQAEVPRNVVSAIRLMYAGFALTGLDIVLSLAVLGQYNSEASQDQQTAALQSAAHSATQMAGATAIALAVDAVGLFAWTWLATAARRGNSRAQAAGTAVLAIYSVFALVFVLVTRNDPGPLAATIAAWAVGLAAVILLRTESARAFFIAWRDRLPVPALPAPVRMARPVSSGCRPVLAGRSGRAAGGLVGPELAMDRNGLRRLAACTFGRRPVAVAERGRVQPRLERALVLPAGYDQPGGAVVSRLQQFEALEAVLSVDRARPGREPPREFVPAAGWHGNRVDLDCCHDVTVLAGATMDC